MDFIGKKVAVIGLAKSGLAAANKLKDKGALVFLSETKTKKELQLSHEIEVKFEVEFGGHSSRILDSDLIVISPGVPLDISIVKNARDRGIPIWSEIELGYQLMKNTSSKIIAITGSNGKSTTTSLIHHILQENGVKALLAGNIGLPFTSFPIEKGIYDYIVLEISSFQLDTINEFHPSIAVLLNITPDHLNRYLNFESYKASKKRIFINQLPNDHAIINFDDPECREVGDSISPQIHIFGLKYYQNNNVFWDGRTITISNIQRTAILKKHELPIQGLHNVSNIIAASITGLITGLHPQKITQAVKTFKGLEHRLEKVRSYKDRVFVNDSKSTNCVSTEKAIASFDKPINLIMGGSDKKEDFSLLKKLMRDHVRNLILLGQTKEQLAQTFDSLLPIHKVENLEEAVRKAFDVSEAGDYILLSPGCASHDMYENFEKRGAHFKELVKDLVTNHEN